MSYFNIVHHTVCSTIYRSIHGLCMRNFVLLLLKMNIFNLRCFNVTNRSDISFDVEL